MSAGEWTFVLCLVFGGWLGIKYQNLHRTCPACMHRVLRGASVCPACGRDLPPVLLNDRQPVRNSPGETVLFVIVGTLLALAALAALFAKITYG